MRIKVHVQGEDRISATGLRSKFAKGLQAGAGYLLNRLQSYPPRPANSRYTRTGRLRSGWGRHERRGGLRQVVANRVGYAGYVIGKEQIGFHKRTGWVRTEERIRREIRGIHGAIQHELVD